MSNDTLFKILVILDGIECCIRNIKIIDNNSIGLYTSNEKS